jgi:hypothetical protein
MPEKSSSDPQQLSPRGAEAIRMARRVNRAWITRGNLAGNTENYLDHLCKTRPGELEQVCERALREARAASRNQKDPKPAFYASIFSGATKAERNDFLREHFFTRLLSAEMHVEQLQAQQ